MKKSVFSALCLSLMSFAVAQPATPVEDDDLENCYKVSNDVYRSGQPDDDGFEELEKRGVKSVLNLREYHSDDDEAEDTSLTLYRYRLAAGSVTKEDLMKCLLIIDQAPKPIVIHCWHGSDRTGIVVAAYRIVMRGWDAAKAKQEMMEKKYGHHYNYYSNLGKLIDNTDWAAFKKEFQERKKAADEAKKKAQSAK